MIIATPTTPPRFITLVLLLIICWLDLGGTNHDPSATFGQQFRAYPTLRPDHIPHSWIL